MLEFYFRFRFLRLHHHRQVILHLPNKFRPNRTIRDRVMTSYPFSKWRTRHRNSTFSFVFRDLLIWEGRNVHSYQISARFLNPWPRYYYFRFLDTNVRHVGILLPVPILRFHHHQRLILHLPIPNFVQIRPPATELWRYIHFQDNGRQPYRIISRLLQTTHEVQMGSQSQAVPQFSTRSDL